MRDSGVGNGGMAIMTSLLQPQTPKRYHLYGGGREIIAAAWRASAILAASAMPVVLRSRPAYGQSEWRSTPNFIMGRGWEYQPYQFALNLVAFVTEARVVVFEQSSERLVETLVSCVSGNQTFGTQRVGIGRHQLRFDVGQRIGGIEIYADIQYKARMPSPPIIPPRDSQEPPDALPFVIEEVVLVGEYVAEVNNLQSLIFNPPRRSDLNFHFYAGPDNYFVTRLDVDADDDWTNDHLRVRFLRNGKPVRQIRREVHTDWHQKGRAHQFQLNDFADTAVLMLEPNTKVYSAQPFGVAIL